MASKIICPLLLAGTMANSTEVPESMAEKAVEITASLIRCKEHACGWWVQTAWTTEGIDTKGRCAIKMIAEKDSDGLIVV